MKLTRFVPNYLVPHTFQWRTEDLRFAPPNIVTAAHAVALAREHGCSMVALLSSELLCAVLRLL